MVRSVPNRGQKARLLVVTVMLLAVTAGCGGSSTALPAKAGKHHGSTKHSRQVAIANLKKTRRHAPLHHTALHKYAVRILPVVDKSAAAFDHAISTVAATNDVTTVGDVCNLQGSNISIIRSYFEGVPHPWAWYTHLGNVYGSAMHVYNYMLGALQACETASGSEDSAGTATALSDMTAADSQMHSTDRYVRWATHQR
jgi:hypothetical protein